MYKFLLSLSTTRSGRCNLHNLKTSNKKIKQGLHKKCALNKTAFKIIIRLFWIKIKCLSSLEAPNK